MFQWLHDMKVNILTSLLRDTIFIKVIREVILSTELSSSEQEPQTSAYRGQGGEVI